jgi:hypothetical protein
LIAALEEVNCVLQVTCAEVDTSQTAIGADKAIRMVRLFSNPHGLLGSGAGFRKVTLLDEGLDEPDAGEHRGQPGLPETLADQVALESVDVALETFARTSVVAPSEVGLSQAEICHDPKGENRMGLCESESAVAGLDSAVDIAR